MSMFKKAEVIKYASVVNGNIAVQCHETTDGAQEVINKSGQKKYYLFYKSITGFIQKIYFKPPPENHSEWANNWIIVLQNGNENCNLQLSFGSGYANAFFSILPNVDPAKEVEIIPIMKKEIYEGKEKIKYSLFMKQSNETLNWYYSKKTGNELPKIEITKLKSGKVIYDDTDRKEFFLKLAEKFNENISNTIENKLKSELSADELDMSENIEGEELPF